MHGATGDGSATMPRGRRERASLALTVLALLAGAGFLLAASAIPGAVGADLAARAPLRPAPPGGPIDLEIASGTPPSRIVAMLAEAGVVRDAGALDALIGFRGLARKLQAGRYRFAAGTSPAEVARILASGPNRPTVITFREGLRNEEIADTLEREGVAKRADFLAALAAPHVEAFLAARPPGPSLLGYLLPDTYSYAPDSTGADMLQAMLDAFGKQVTPDLLADAQRSGLTLHEVVTLASIVERETAARDERPLIAAVFRNRLKQEIPLQADPTVQFALTRQPGFDPAGGYWKRLLTVPDLGVDSPYNTYKQRGLPPGPIANPGIDAIRAVVRPADVNWLYFVASPACDRTHRFSSTLAAHNANVEAFAASACAREMTAQGGR